MFLLELGQEKKNEKRQYYNYDRLRSVWRRPMKKHGNMMRIIVVGLGFAVLMGCAHIPREAPDLSAELGNQISSVEKAHLALLHQFFELKRNEIDEFVQEEYLPVFAKNFFSEPKISSGWNTIVSENDPSERLKFLTVVGVKLQVEIDRRRAILIDPINSMEIEVTRALEAEYEQAKAINQALTGLLYSGSEVSENRQRYLEMVGVSDEKVESVINKVGDVVGKMLEGAKEAEDKAPEIDEYLQKFNELKEKLKVKGKD